jgi:methionyl aminopeptidase
MQAVIPSPGGRVMTIGHEDELVSPRRVGRLVADTMGAMARALEPGMTTGELDQLGRLLLERDGARSAPEVTYDFPGATCISVSPDIAHGIPGDRALRAGDLVNIDVSAEIDGVFADTGGSFAMPPVSPRIDRLSRDGRRALWTGVRAVKAGGRLNAIGRAIQTFADRNGYTLIRNLASHGVGDALHEEPKEIATWYEPGDQRRIGVARSSPSSPSCPWAPSGRWMPGTAGRSAPTAAGRPCSTSTPWWRRRVVRSWSPCRASDGGLG